MTTVYGFELVIHKNKRTKGYYITLKRKLFRYTNLVVTVSKAQHSPHYPVYHGKFFNNSEFVIYLGCSGVPAYGDNDFIELLQAVQYAKSVLAKMGS